MENHILSTRKPKKNKKKNKNKRKHFTKLRISYHHLTIETGRCLMPVTPRDQHFLKSSDMVVIGNEFYFILVCPQHDKQRLILFDQLSEFISLSNEQDLHTFIQFMNCCQGDTEVSNPVSQFVQKCLTKI